MSEHHSVIEVRQLIARLVAVKVVDIQEVRRLKNRLEALRASRNWEALMEWLEKLQRENAGALCSLGGDMLLEWIAHAVDLCSADGIPTATAVAAWLVERGYTWKLSRQLRRFYSYGHPVPVVHVDGYVRAGVKVHAHRRLIGNDHLRALSADGWPPIVGEVVRELAERISF